MDRTETISELIEKQINEAASFLAHAKTMKNRDRDIDKTLGALIAMNGRLLEIVQNQQVEIDKWSQSLCEVQVDVNDLVDEHPYDPKKSRRTHRHV